MVKALTLRKKENLLKIQQKPGYYKWWALNEELFVILKALNLDYSKIKDFIEYKDGFYCIYVGIAVKESVRDRLNWHINDSHTPARVQNGILSTLRQSIASIVSNNQFDKLHTDYFMNKLFVEYFYSDNEVKTAVAKNELISIEKKLMNDYLRILNIRDNHHPAAEGVIKNLKELRKKSKS